MVLPLAILWSIVAFFGACAFGADVLAKRRVAASVAWPTAAARIVNAELVQSSYGGWLVRVSYAYEVAGHTYASDRLRPGGNPFFRREPKAIATLAPYAVGGSAVARYDPAHPERSALELQPVSHARSALLVTTAAMAATALILTIALIPGTPA